MRELVNQRAQLYHPIEARTKLMVPDANDLFWGSWAMKVSAKYMESAHTVKAISLEQYGVLKGAMASGG